MFLWVTVVPLCLPVVLLIISTKHYHQMLKLPLLYLHGSVDDVGLVKDLRCPLFFTQGAADDGVTLLLRCWLLHPQEDVSIPSERRASLQRLLHQAPCHHTRYSRIRTNTQKKDGKHTELVFCHLGSEWHFTCKPLWEFSQGRLDYLTQRRNCIRYYFL